MGYDSVDKLQNILASEVFHYTNDKKKAAGRALGTFVELITYYVIKNWNLETFASIERPLPEFANSEITHNSENQNKELKVLAQSYDWLIFLTDNGIGEFITDLLIKPKKENKPIKEAFKKSYNENKKGNIFTKVKIDYYADMALTNYFKQNEAKIKLWFNVITPKNKDLSELRNELFLLSNKKWWEIY